MARNQKGEQDQKKKQKTVKATNRNDSTHNINNI